MTDNIYIGGNEIIFNQSTELEQYGGGFSVKDIMNKANISPILSMNFSNKKSTQTGGDSDNKVSDLFHNLAVPNWATKYNMYGGEYKDNDKKNSDNDNDSDSDIDDDLHDKLLGLVKEHENKLKQTNKKKTKRKIEDKSIIKKNTTKKNKKNKKNNAEDNTEDNN
jgi:hypothetical protein